MSSILDTFQVNLTDANCHILVREFDTEAQTCFCFSIVGLDYSDAFFARAKFRGGAKNEKYRTATYLFLVKNLGNFTNKNAKNISKILIKIGKALILIDFLLIHLPRKMKSKRCHTRKIAKLLKNFPNLRSEKTKRKMH